MKTGHKKRRPPRKEREASAAARSEMTPEQAARVLTQSQRRKIEDCKAAVLKALDEFGCTIRAWPFVRPDGRLDAACEVALRPPPEPTSQNGSR